MRYIKHLGSSYPPNRLSRVKSALIAVNDVKAGEAVGYGATWRCPRDMRIGIVAMGYGDGYPRHAASGTPILVKGRRAALIGKASMDMLTVDLRGMPFSIGFLPITHRHAPS